MSTPPQRVIDRCFTHYVAVGDMEECWPAKVHIGRSGYARVGWSESGKTHAVSVHRLAWIAACGPIPDGLTIDHMCRVPRCCNPQHLRLLTLSANCSDNGRWQLRKTHCPQGHEYTEANTQLTAQGYRKCRACHREDQARRRKSVTDTPELFEVRHKGCTG